MSAAETEGRRKATLAHEPHYGVLDLAEGRSLDLYEFVGEGDYAELVEKRRVALEHDLLDGKVRYVCEKCRKAMVLRSIPANKNTEDRFYLKHRFKSEDCGGTRGLSRDAICAMKYGNTKEGVSHKLYKSIIASSIAADPAFTNTDVESHWVDVDGVRWRQPDVQTERDGIRVALEVQLSTTFLHVIAQRQSFYRRNLGRLVWFFRDLGIAGFRQAEDDIFYSNNRNAFHVSPATLERSQREGRFVMDCAWHAPRIVDGSLVDVRMQDTVNFDQLQFDVSDIGVPRAYYFDYDRARAALDDQLRRQAEEDRRNAQEALDAPLRQLMEEMVLGYTDDADSAVSWDNVRARFGARGFDLPDHFYYNDGLFPILQAAYSAKEGRPVACRQTHLIQLANTLFNSHMRSLLVFSVMMGHYDRAALLISRGNTEEWLKKVRKYHAGWLDGDPQYAPDRRYDDLLAFLFPEAAGKLRMPPSEVAAKRRC